MEAVETASPVHQDAPEEKTSGSRKLSSAHSSCRLFWEGRDVGAAHAIVSGHMEPPLSNSGSSHWRFQRQCTVRSQQQADQLQNLRLQFVTAALQCPCPHLQRRAGDEHAVVGLQQAHHLQGWIGGRRAWHGVSNGRS